MSAPGPNESSAAAVPASSSSSTSTTTPADGKLRPMPRFSTRVKGAPSKLLDELIATPAIKKRRNVSGAGRPSKKLKPGMTMAMAGMPPGMMMGYPGGPVPTEQQRKLLGSMGLPFGNLAFRIPPGVLPGMANPFNYPPTLAAAATLPPGTTTSATATANFRPGTAAASHVAAFPAVPIAPHHLLAQDGEDYMEDAHPEEAARSSGDLVTMLAHTRCCALTPASFFVAWHGVLTLSFIGFPSSIANLKSELTAREHELGLPPEQNGSKWPKITLAVLREGRTLTLEQLRRLYEITQQFKEKVRTDPWRLAVRELSYVKFGNRSLERIIVRTDVPLKESLQLRAAAAVAAAGGAAGLGAKLPQDVPESESAKVNTVLNEINDTPGSVEHYLAHVNKPGGRATHYQTPYSESTLVVFAHPTRPPVLSNLSKPPAYFAEFRDAVDSILPEYYEWFPWQALHCTIRTMA